MRARDPSRPRRRRWPALLAAALLLLAAAGYAIFRIATREDAQPASVRQALERFRALPAAAREPLEQFGTSPALGVYVYDTRGGEVSHVLGTRRHAYPPRTTITVNTVGPRCVRTRWDALATRWDADVACLRGGSPDWLLASESEEHEFAGHVDRRTYRCTPASVARPDALRVGARWTSSCSIDGTTTADRTVVIGQRTLTVGGRRVRTWLLFTRTRVSGDTTGTGTASTWVLQGLSPVVVRRVVRNASTTRTIVGDVAYEERYALTLRALRPLT